MADVTRRSFFRLAAGAVALAAVPAPVLSAGEPTLWADGINCDADGIMAMFRGETVRFIQPDIASRIIRNGTSINFGKARIFLRKPVHLSSRGGLIAVTDLHLHILDGFDGNYALEISDRHG